MVETKSAPMNEALDREELTAQLTHMTFRLEELRGRLEAGRVTDMHPWAAEVGAVEFEVTVLEQAIVLRGV
jgi:RecB family exonuclease